MATRPSSGGSLSVQCLNFKYITFRGITFFVCVCWGGGGGGVGGRYIVGYTVGKAFVLRQHYFQPYILMVIPILVLSNLCIPILKYFLIINIENINMNKTEQLTVQGMRHILQHL